MLLPNCMHKRPASSLTFHVSHSLRTRYEDPVQTMPSIVLTGLNQQAQALSRGKRSKARRAKDKYADQDEEDRELAMQLLASSGVCQAAAPGCLQPAPG